MKHQSHFVKFLATSIFSLVSIFSIPFAASQIGEGEFEQDSISNSAQEDLNKTELHSDNSTVVSTITTAVEKIPDMIECIDADFLDEVESTYRVNRTQNNSRKKGTEAELSPLPAGYLYSPATEESERIVVPLQNTYVVMDITPGLAETTLVQEFTNTTNETLEATYLFPLPSKATITNMELHFDNHIISSKVQEKQQARVSYEKAKAEGKKSALIEHHLHGIFNTAVANFKPGETVSIHISYIEDISYQRDGYNIRFPLLARDKYFPQEKTTRKVPEKQTLSKRPNTPKRSFTGHKNSIEQPTTFSSSHTTIFDIQVSGIPIDSIQSISHDLMVSSIDNSYSITLADPIHIPHKDLHIHLKTRKIETTQTTIVSSSSSEANYGLLTIYPPKELQIPDEEKAPRDIIFLIDNSGSMFGDRMKNTKKGVSSALNKLRSTDRFNIINFNSTFDIYSENLQNADTPDIKKAQNHINNIEAGGGTTMQPALLQSLKILSDNDGRTKIIVFFGDGYLGDEQSLMSILENKLESIRLFTFGIGSGIDDFMINQMAEAGRGQARFIFDVENIQQKINDLFTTLSTPVLTDIELTFFDNNNKPINLFSFPDPVRDLFLDEPVQVSYRVEDSIPSKVVMKARRGKQDIFKIFSIDVTGTSHPSIEFLFAQKWINQIRAEIYQSDSETEREALKKEITKIALLFQLVTEYTSRVAIQQTPNNNHSSGVPSGIHQLSNDEDVFELSPFVVGASQDISWRSTNSTAGTSLNTSMKDIPMSVEIITSEFLEDSGATDFEDALSYSAGLNILSEKESYTNNSFNIDRNKNTSPIDIHTISRIEIQNSPTTDLFNAASPFKTANIIRTRAFSQRYTSIGATVGSKDDYNQIWFDHNQPILDDNALSIRSIASKTEDTRSHKNIYIQTESDFSTGTQISSTFQHSDISNFGSFKNYSLNTIQSIFENTYASYSYSNSTVKLEKSTRFLIGHSGDELFDFSNASQLYSTVNFDEQKIDQHTFKLKSYADFHNSTHDIALFARHSKSEESLISTHDVNSSIDRKTNISDAAYTYQLSLFESALNLVAGQKYSQIKNEYITHETSHLSSNVGFKWDINSDLTLKYNFVKSDENQSILQQAFLDLDQSPHTIPPAELESAKGTGHDISLAFDLLDSRVSGNFLYFNTSQQNLAFRDWSTEQRLNQQYIDNGLQQFAPALYDEFLKAKQEGVALNLNIQPTQNLSIIFNGYTNLASNLPVTGAETKLSTFGLYTIRDGILRGVKLGGGARYGDAQYYDDGYALPQYLVFDFNIGYEVDSFSPHKTTISLNLKNLGNENIQYSRFNKPSSREVFLSVKTEF